MACLFIEGCSKAATETVLSTSTYVDVGLGSDINGDGSLQRPFRTITHAMTAPNHGTALVLAPGTYDSTSGEKFPLILTLGMVLAGGKMDMANGVYARIIGAGIYTSPSQQKDFSVAVVINGGRAISGLVVEAPSGIAVWDEGSSQEAEVLNSVVRGSMTGIVVAGQSTTKLSSNTITGNSASGVEILGPAAPTLLKNIISANGVGVTIHPGARPVFRTDDSYGSNEIKSNAACDLRHLGDADLDVVGTVWDDDIFNFSVQSTCADSANIVVAATGAVDYQFVPSSTALLFPNSRRIDLLSPGFGALLLTRQPALSWKGTGARLAAAAILERPPIVDAGGLVNVKDIVWFWHSGLSTGSPGSASYSDGITPVAGNISAGAAPQPLPAGRSYYWAVWEWDEQAQNIAASSSLSYFRVSK